MTIQVGRITLDQAIEMFSPRIATTAIVQALNTATTRAQQAQAESVAKTYTITRAAFKKTLILRRAKANNLQTASVSVSQITPITIHKPKQDAQGIVVSVKRGHRKSIPHGFLAFFGTGRHLGGAIRVPGSSVHESLRKRSRHHGRTIRRGPRKGEFIKREALKQLYGATLAHLADNPEVVEAAQRRMGDVLPIIFEEKLEKLLEKAIQKIS